MARINDRNRVRRTYSFFRAPPAPETCITEAGASMINFDNIGQMQTEDVTNFESGELAFVKTLRDFFFLEKTVTSGTLNSIDIIAAPLSLGVWYRMNLGGPYWKNQTKWYINPALGNDENLGSIDTPLASHDELIRRFLGTTKIVDDYIVTFQSSSILTSNFALDAEFDGGSIKYRGIPEDVGILGTITSLDPDVDYDSEQIPLIQAGGTFTGGENLIYSNVNGFLGWKLGFANPGVFLSEVTSSFSGTIAVDTSVPLWTTHLVSARGFGTIVFEDMAIRTTDISQDPGTTVEFLRSRILPSDVSPTNTMGIHGGTVLFDHSELSASSHNVEIGNKSTVIFSGSAITSANKNVIVKQDSTIELGATVIFSSSLKVNSAKAIMSLNGTSGSAVVDGYIEAQSDSIVDVRNLFSSGSTTDPVRLTGVAASIFFDEANLPKADNISVNNGIETTYLWSEMPYIDLLRDARIISGTLVNS